MEPIFLAILLHGMEIIVAVLHTHQEVLIGNPKTCRFAHRESSKNERKRSDYIPRIFFVRREP
jgi:hypothetical protein